MVFIEKQMERNMDNTREGSNLNAEQPITSNTSPTMSGSVRKRGHQHHIRYSGTRSSNVKADEVIAALRKGDQLPITQTIHQYSEMEESLPLGFDMNLTVDDLTEHQLLHGDSNKAAQSNVTTDRNGNRNLNNDNSKRITLIDDCNKNNRLDVTSKCANRLIDSTNEQLNRKNVISKESDKDLAESTVDAEPIGALNSDIDMESTQRDDLNDSISSGSSAGSKSKSKRSKKGQPIASQSENGAKKEKRSRKSKGLPPTEERPPLEGADADHWTENDPTVDTENDPEAAEWSKLRCTSERTEVVAEREYRRQNRRCADYPGLAFGRSIFSSDTMMKLNIIRNELHNIMKTQLKRVCVIDGRQDARTLNNNGRCTW